MTSLSSRSLDLRKVESSVVAVQKAAAELLIEAARLIDSGKVEVPGVIVLRVIRERFDCQVIAEFKPFNPSENVA